jgi:hypothetical protein
MAKVTKPVAKKPAKREIKPKERIMTNANPAPPPHEVKPAEPPAPKPEVKPKEKPKEDDPEMEIHSKAGAARRAVVRKAIAEARAEANDPTPVAGLRAE